MADIAAADRIIVIVRIAEQAYSWTSKVGPSLIIIWSDSSKSINMKYTYVRVCISTQITFFLASFPHAFTSRLITLLTLV